MLSYVWAISPWSVVVRVGYIPLVSSCNTLPSHRKNVQLFFFSPSFLCHLGNIHFLTTLRGSLSACTFLSIGFKSVSDVTCKVLNLSESESIL